MRGLRLLVGLICSTQQKRRPLTCQQPTWELQLAKEAAYDSIGLESVKITENPAFPLLPYPAWEAKDSGLNIINTLIPSGSSEITLPIGVLTEGSLHKIPGRDAHEGEHWAGIVRHMFVSPLGITWYVEYGIETLARMANHGRTLAGTTAKKKPVTRGKIFPIEVPMRVSRVFMPLRAHVLLVVSVVAIFTFSCDGGAKDDKSIEIVNNLNEPVRVIVVRVDQDETLPFDLERVFAKYPTIDWSSNNSSLLPAGAQDTFFTLYPSNRHPSLFDQKVLVSAWTDERRTLFQTFLEWDQLFIGTDQVLTLVMD